MSSQTYFTRIGAAKVRLPVRLNTTLPNLSSLVFTASAINAAGSMLDAVVNDQNSALDSTASYYVTLVLLGEDRTNGGLTYSASSPVSGPITVSGTNPGILINIAAANFPSNMNKAYAMGVMLRKNSSDYALAAYGIIDTNGNDFNYTLNFEPLPSQTLYPIGTLNTATADYATYPELGSRVAYGVSFSPSLRTTGGVEVGRDVNAITVAPDNSTDYPQKAGSGTTIRFAVLSNTVKQIVLANSGNYAKVTTPGSHTVQTAAMSLQTAVSITTGNVPVQLLMPPDENRNVEVRYYLASVSVNPVGNSERWTKTATAPVQYNVVTANQDPLLNDVSVEISYTYKA